MTEFTYAEVGATRHEPLPPGYRHLHYRTELGRGDFAAAADASHVSGPGAPPTRAFGDLRPELGSARELRRAQELGRAHLARVGMTPEHVEALVLAAEGTSSMVAVPIFLVDGWWGFLGADDCGRGRVWSPSEIELLLVVVESHVVTAVASHVPSLSSRSIPIRSSLWPALRRMTESSASSVTLFNCFVMGGIEDSLAGIFEGVGLRAIAGDQVFLGHVTYAPGTVVARHAHSESEQAMWIVEGSMVMTVGDETRDLGAAGAVHARDRDDSHASRQRGRIRTCSTTRAALCVARAAMATKWVRFWNSRGRSAARRRKASLTSAVGCSV